ncbi:MAG: hypothetical protein Q9184_001557 [Pyrenodesmia sp. 2 TL-2023]
MHIASPRNGLIVFALLSQTVLAIHPKHHAFLKRQGCARIDSQCTSVGSTLSDCINYVCSSCTDVDPTIGQCCELSTNVDIADCIMENLDSDTSSSFDETTVDDGTASATSFGSTDSTATRVTSTGTAAFPSTSIFVYPACSSIGSKLEACESATPGFQYLSLWDSQASCYCYQGSNFAPSSFDNYYSSCLEYLSTDNTEAYSLLTVTGDTGEAVSTPCASMGNVRETSPATEQGGAVGGGSQNTGSTARASPGASVATSNTAFPTPTTTGPRTGSSAGGGEGNVAGSSADGMPLKSAFALFASLVGLLYLL